MARRSEFRVQSPRRKADLIVRPRKSQVPKIDIEHRSLGIGCMRGLRPSGSGGFCVDVEFGGVTRTLRLEQSYWVTPISDVLALLPLFPASKTPVEKEAKVKSADNEEDLDEVTPELGMEPVPETEDSDAEDGQGSEEEMEI